MLIRNLRALTLIASPSIPVDQTDGFGLQKQGRAERCDVDEAFIDSNSILPSLLIPGLCLHSSVLSTSPGTLGEVIAQSLMP